MKNPSFLLTLVVALLAASWSRSRAVSVSCGWDGSTYEANLHRLVAVFPAEASATRRRTAYRAIGYWPNRLQATSSCWGGGDGDCAACIAEAFKEVERECPFRREAFYLGDSCYLRLAEYSIF